MKKYITIIFLVFLFQTSLYSQRNLSNFSPGAKSIALGRTGVVNISDPTALFWNPALLGDIKRRSAVVAINEPHHLTYTGYSQFIPLAGTFSASISHTQKDESGIELYSVGWGKQITRFVYTGIAINNAISMNDNWVTAGFGLYIKADSKSSPVYQSFTPLSFLQSPVFRDRFQMGICVQNIPVTETLHDHQTRLGASYKLTEDGFTIMFGYHIQRIDNTSHLSLILPIQKNFKFMAGTMDYHFNKTALGAQVNMAGLDVQLVYDYNVKRFLFSTVVNIGQTLGEQSEAEHGLAKTAVENQYPDIALYHTKRALEYNAQNQNASKYYRILAPLVMQNKAKAQRTLQTALQLEQNEWYISAAMHFMKVLKLDPENREAERALERIRPRVNVHTERRFELGLATLEKQELLKAKDIFESILYVRPDHEQSRFYLQQTNDQLHKEAENHFYTGLGYFSQRKYDLAEQEFNTSLKYFPAYSEARDYIDRIQQTRENNVKRVADLLQQARALENRGSWTQAKNRYNEILSIDPDHSSARKNLEHVNRELNRLVKQNIKKGVKAFKDNNLGPAAKIFNNILKIDPGNSTAREYIQKINKNSSAMSKEYLDRAQNHMNNSNWDLALTVIDSALSNYPESSEAAAMKSEIINHMNSSQMLANANREYRNSNYMQSMEILNQILVKDPDNIQALKMLEECQKRLNELVDNYFNKGLEMYTKENYRTAIMMWEKALEINPYHQGSLEYMKRAKERLRAIEQLQN